MKKLVAFLTVCAVMTGAFASCGSEEKEESESEKDISVSESSEEETTEETESETEEETESETEEETQPETEEETEPETEEETEPETEEETEPEIEEETEPETEEETEPETEEETESFEELNVSNGNLTVDNCPELAEILSNKASNDPSYSSFATKYKGKIIEFDGRIDYCTNHKNYKTRFDYLVSAGDYDPNTMTGPNFKFEDVNYYDLNTDVETVSVGLNVHIVAKVLSFDSVSELFYLDPVSVTSR